MLIEHLKHFLIDVSQQKHLTGAVQHRAEHITADSQGLCCIVSGLSQAYQMIHPSAAFSEIQQNSTAAYSNDTSISTPATICQLLFPASAANIQLPDVNQSFLHQAELAVETPADGMISESLDSSPHNVYVLARE